VWGVVKLYNGI